MSSEPLVASVVHKNIKTMLQVRQQAEDRRGYQYRLVSRITEYMGSFPFVLVQAAFISLWVGINSDWVSGVWKFDKFPYPLLSIAMTAEAIFIAIFILMNQNHMKDLAQKREDLDVQISLLTEHEVTQIMSMTEKISKHLNIKEKNQNIQDLKTETSPEKVLQVIELEIEKMEK